MRFLATLAMALAFTGCAAHAPGRAETAIITRAKRFSVPGRKQANPLPATAENMHAGQVIFGQYCFACHGLDGQKTGVPFADTMSPPIPSLAAPEVQAYSDGQLQWVIRHGLFPSGMPASDGILREEEMWQIVAYLRHLPARGSLGEPVAYGGAQPAAKAQAVQNSAPGNRCPHPK